MRHLCWALMVCYMHELTDLSQVGAILPSVLRWQFQILQFEVLLRGTGRVEIWTLGSNTKACKVSWSDFQRLFFVSVGPKLTTNSVDLCVWLGMVCSQLLFWLVRPLPLSIQYLHSLGISGDWLQSCHGHQNPKCSKSVTPSDSVVAYDLCTSSHIH